jgi:hypothetical protein
MHVAPARIDVASASSGRGSYFLGFLLHRCPSCEYYADETYDSDASVEIPFVALVSVEVVDAKMLRDSQYQRNDDEQSA